METNKNLIIKKYDITTMFPFVVAFGNRMRDTDKKKNLFTQLKKNERDRKKLMDTVLKQLKALLPALYNK